VEVTDVELDGVQVLVTGANGFVGARMVRRLAAGGARVRAMVRREATAEVAGIDGATEVIGDPVEGPDLQRFASGCDAIVHCAATATDDLPAARRVNRDGTRNVVEAALAGHVGRLVHISTTSVYDRDRADGEVDEDTPLVAEGDAYSLSKAEAEREVLAGMQRGLAATILRPPAVLGWGPTSTWGQWFPARVAAGDVPFTPHPDATHAWVHVDDLTDAAVVALADDRAVGRTYQVIGGQGTWRDYLEAVLDIVGDASDPFAGGARPPWTGRYRTGRIREELGFSPQRSLADAMRETAEHRHG
jgi:nucleoside-diphosphate-sugar epimerase